MRITVGRTYGDRGAWFSCLLVLLLSCTFYSCGNKMKDQPVTVRKEAVPEEAMNVESYMSEGAVVKGKLTAPYMVRVQKADSPYAEFPKSLHVDFYNAAMVIESQMDALYGKYLQNQHKVYLRDTVVVKNILKGDTVHCQELWWDQKTERFYTDKPVRIYTKDKILYGIGMEADQNFRWYNILHMTGSILTSQNQTLK